MCLEKYSIFSICSICCTSGISVSLSQTGQLSDLVMSKSVTVDYKGVHFTLLIKPGRCRQTGWLTERETLALYADTAINTHEAVCHAACILNRGSHTTCDR